MNTLSEGFDDITTLSGSGWTQTNNSSPLGTTGWFQGDNIRAFGSQSGAANSYIAVNFESVTLATGFGPKTISNWLITPTLDLVDGSQFSFFTRTVDNPAGFPDRLQVLLSTNGASTNVGSSATEIGDFTTLLTVVNPNLASIGYPNTFTQFSSILTGIPTPTTGKIAFRYFVPNGGNTGANSNYIGIDTVSYTSAVPVPFEFSPHFGILAIFGWFMFSRFKKGK
jgi:hypothetical protein